MTKTTGLILALSLLLSINAWAADDPSIKGELRGNIQQSMSDFINSQTVNGNMYVYDAVNGDLLKLKLDKLHSGIVKKGGFYVSCADFKDQNNRKIDIDFFVVPNEGRMVTTQAFVHSIDGNKRKYHLEDL